MTKLKENSNTDHWLEETLNAAPGFKLPGNFADRVAAMAVRRFAWNQYFKEFLIYLGAVAGIAALSVAMAFVWLDASWKEWLAFIAENITIFVGVNILAVFVLFADKVLLRFFFYRFSKSSVDGATQPQ